MEITLADIRAAIALDPFDDRGARLLMAHTHRHNYPEPPEYRDGSVLILLYPGEESLTLVLTRRTEEVEHHRRQIALPGGAREGDESLADTALRETEEEVGVPRDAVEILGRLVPFHIPVSGFRVHPFVGYVSERPTYRPDPREVSRVIDVSLGHLLCEENRGEEEWEVMGEMSRVPFYRLPDTRPPPLWGATAMILSGLLERIRFIGV